MHARFDAAIRPDLFLAAAEAAHACDLANTLPRDGATTTPDIKEDL